MATSPNDLADALIRMFGRDAVRQARENAASNARAGDHAGEKMWQDVAGIVAGKLLLSGRVRPR